MKEFEELQQLWQKAAPASGLDFDKIMQQIEADKKDIALKLWRHIIAFIAGLLVLGYVWFTVPFVTWTSHVAILIVAGCMIYALLAQWRAYQDFKTISTGSTDKPEAYIAFLKKFKADRYQQHTRNFVLYETCIAAAFAFYSFELYFALPLGMFIALIVFIVFWFLISHFVFLRAYIENENEKIQNLINELDRIKDQFNLSK